LKKWWRFQIFKFPEIFRQILTEVEQKQLKDGRNQFEIFAKKSAKISTIFAEILRPWRCKRMCKSCRSRQELSNRQLCQRVFTCKIWLRWSRERAFGNLEFGKEFGNLDGRKLLF
jgi:hypothetical protein